MWVSRLTGAYDNRPVLEDVGLDLFDQWQVLREPAWDNKAAVSRAKKTIRAWSPTIWQEGFTRGTEGVLGLSAVVLDVDGATAPVEDVLAAFAQYNFVAHTTFQHTADLARYRIVLPFEQPLPVDAHYAAYWHAAGFLERLGVSADPTASEASRLYYLPATTPSRQPLAWSIRWDGGRYMAPPVVAAPRPAPRAATAVEDAGPVVTWGMERGDIALLDQGCAFSRHARDNAATLREPQWRAAMSLWLRCKDGEALCHERSRPYDGYDYDETADKIAALRDVGAFTCPTIRTLAPGACAGCTQRCGSPVELATPAPEVPASVVAASKAADWLATARETEAQAYQTLIEASEALRRLRAVGSQDEVRAAAAKKVAAEQAHRAAKSNTKAAERAERRAMASGSAPVAAPEGADPQVWARLAFDLRAGAPKSTKGNVGLVLEHDPRYAGRLRWNSFAYSVCLDGVEQTDHGDTAVARDLEYRYALCVPTNYVREVGLEIAHKATFHPVRDWLESLSWDGEDRISQLMERGFGALRNPDDPEIVGEMGRLFLLSVVARVYEPGVKVDTMLILTGRQNASKSSALRALVSPPGYAPRLGWFGDSKLRNLGDKDTAQLLLGKLIWEIAELGSSWRNADARDRKQWLSQQEDRYRPPYGHRPIDVPRTCVVVGTTNDDTFLTDPTGNRRYLCAAVTTVDIAWIKAHRDQLFAQALVEYKAGTRYWVDSVFQPRLEAHNRRFAENDIWLAIIEAWLAKTRPQTVSLESVIQRALGLDPVSIATRDVTRVRDALRSLGCTIDTDSRSRTALWKLPESLTRQSEEVTHHSGVVVPFEKRAAG